MKQRSRLLYEYKDDFEWIRIVDLHPQEHRYLHFETSIQGVLNLRDHQHPVLEYVGLMAYAANALQSRPQRALIGGLGSAALVHRLQHWWGPGVICTIEPNPRVLELAKRFFRIDQHFEIHIDGLREALESNDFTHLDCLFVDCYTDLNIPPELATVEFMYLIQQKLNAQGFAFFNLWSPGCNRICAHQIYTILNVFDEIAVITCREDANLIVVAANDKETSWPDELLFKGFSYPLLRISKNDQKTWPDYLDEGRLIEDTNVGEIFEQTGRTF